MAAGLGDALKKLLSVLQKVRYQAVVIGDAAHRAHGSAREPRVLELMMATNEKQRAAIVTAAKAQGLLSLEAPPNWMRFKAGDVEIRILEASTPFHRSLLSRAMPEQVMGVWSLVASPEDLILRRAGSDLPADKESVIEMFKLKEGKLDPDYLQAQGEAAKIFDRVKLFWKASRG